MAETPEEVTPRSVLLGCPEEHRRRSNGPLCCEPCLRSALRAQYVAGQSEEREAIAAWHDDWARRCADLARTEEAADRHFNATSCDAYKRLHEEAAATIRARIRELAEQAKRE